MLIHGIKKLTLLDFPEHTACTLFTGACNFRCPFCQNSALVLHPESEPQLDLDEIIRFLKKRKPVLQGVCFTGGEPTLQKDLIPFIERIRELGYEVKLDTNGYRPKTLSEILEKDLINGCAMDIKSSPEHYALAAGIPEDKFDISKIRESVDLLKQYGAGHPDFYYEFRTTMVKGLQTEDDMHSIGRWLKGEEHYFLQNFESSDGVMDQSMCPFEYDELEHMTDIVRTYIPNVKLRGV